MSDPGLYNSDTPDSPVLTIELVGKALAGIAAAVLGIGLLVRGRWVK